MDICKINFISFNFQKSQFALAYDNGINIYDTKTFTLLSKSAEIGDIAIVALIYETNIVIFSGSEKNNDYPPTKIVLYDNKKKSEIYSSIVKLPILAIKNVNKILFVETNKEISVFKYENDDDVFFVNKIEISFDVRFPFIVFQNETNTNNEEEYIIITQGDKYYLNVYMINISTYKFSLKNKIKIHYDYIQSIIEDNQSKCFYVCDYRGELISEIDLDSINEVEREFYRGNSYAKISSVMKIKNTYLAICNCNKTIHIYSLEKKKKANNIYLYMSSLIVNHGNNVYYSYIKIDIDDMITKKKNPFMYYCDKMGCLLTYDNKEEVLKVICYNGIGLKIKINFLKSKYKLISNYEWICNDSPNTNNVNDFEVIEPLRTVNYNDNILGENQNSLFESTNNFVSFNNRF